MYENILIKGHKIIQYWKDLFQISKFGSRKTEPSDNIAKLISEGMIVRKPTGDILPTVKAPSNL